VRCAEICFQDHHSITRERPKEATPLRLTPQALLPDAASIYNLIMPEPTADVLTRARQIRLLLMDIDGTLSKGVCLISLPNEGGVAEMKNFDPHDGLALKLAHTMGIRTGFITGRKSPAVAQRAHECDVDYVYLGQATKTHAYEECLQKAGVTDAETAYLGDDLPDMPLSRRAGLAIAVANAAPELKAISHYITESRGGEGAAREAVELILKAQGRWEAAIPLALA
jgi:3-deoxy-D-manno-octulosonate 8-phosphate phosphatase (KDO 8-P phosphatase)